MIEFAEDQVLVPALRDDDITLIPGTLAEHKEYLFKLVGLDRYNRTPREQLEHGLGFVRYFWLGKCAETVGGVLFICQLPHMGWWTLDAYKDDTLDNRVGDYSFRAGRLVIDWFFANHQVNELYTMHRTANVAATKICERLGFKQKYLNPQFIILQTRRLIWV